MPAQKHSDTVLKQKCSEKDASTRTRSNMATSSQPCLGTPINLTLATLSQLEARRAKMFIQSADKEYGQKGGEKSKLALLTSVGCAEIYADCIRRLAPNQFLDDEVINGYTERLKQHCRISLKETKVDILPTFFMAKLCPLYCPDTESERKRGRRSRARQSTYDPNHIWISKRTGRDQIKNRMWLANDIILVPCNIRNTN